MGAQPKNKITRVEQGKRRRGNKAKIGKDHNITATLLSRKTLSQRILARFKTK